MTTTNARAAAAALNREIVDDQPERLTIHTHHITLTQAHLPYQVVAGKRLPSEKHFAVYADQITLAGVLQNPGRNIELHAREIVITTPAILDAAGAYANKDFKRGDPATQKSILPGAVGSNGDDATIGQPAGDIIIAADHIVDQTPGEHTLSVSELSAVGAQIVAANPPKIGDSCALPTMEYARLEIHFTMTFTMEDGHVDGLSHVAFESSHYDAGSSRLGVRLLIGPLTLSGKDRDSQRHVATNPFRCRVDATALLGTDGAISDFHSDLTLVSDKPIEIVGAAFPSPVLESALKTIRERVAAHVGGAAEGVAKAFGGRLRGAALTLLASGGRGGRGQDGHDGVAGAKGADGVKTSKPGVELDTGYGFPPEAIGQPGTPGGGAGSPGASANGGNGGHVRLQVVQPLGLSLIYSVAAGAGGEQASAGARGTGGPGGAGQVCHMYNAKTGRPIDDMKAPDGAYGGTGAGPAKLGTTGAPGAAGEPITINGAPFTASGAVPVLTLAGLAPALSLSQLLITQNATDQGFQNATSDTQRLVVADGYTWLIAINQPFTDTAHPIDQTRVSLPEQKVRVAMHNGAVVSLMRLQQGLDYYGHSYNWAPVLNLNSLVARTGELIQLGKVVEDQFNRYLDKALSDKERMKSFTQAKQEIDQKLSQFDAEINKLTPQIEGFQTEVDKQTEALRLQRTVLETDQLKFKDDLTKYLREQDQLDWKDFLDILGTVIGCVGGVVSGVGGIKTAFDAFKKAQEFSEKVKKAVAVFKKAKATFDSLKKTYASVADAFDEGNVNAAKILVDDGEYDKLIKEYIDKVDSAGELREAMQYYVTLCQARNMSAYNYTALVSQQLALKAERDQLYQGIQHINAEIAGRQDNVLAIYTAYLQDAYEDLQRHLLRNIYLENRAYQYWSLKDRVLQTEDLTIATLSATHGLLIADIDGFRENTQAASDFTQKVTIAAARYPNEFAALVKSRALAFELDIHKEKGFQNMRHIVVSKFTLELPEVNGGSNVLFVNLVHSGEAVLNSDTDLAAPGALHVFSHRPRMAPYKIDYQDSRNTAGGTLGDETQGYIGVSPFAVWRLDFNLQGNDWLDLTKVKTVTLVFSGKILGPARLH
jgi:hypothetical protein